VAKCLVRSKRPLALRTQARRWAAPADEDRGREP
jgi:hypothetical protein